MLKQVQGTHLPLSPWWHKRHLSGTRSEPGVGNVAGLEVFRKGINRYSGKSHKVALTLFPPIYSDQIYYFLSLWRIRLMYKVIHSIGHILNWLPCSVNSEPRCSAPRRTKLRERITACVLTPHQNSHCSSAYPTVLCKTVIACSQIWLHWKDVLGIVNYFKMLQNLPFLLHLRLRKPKALQSCFAIGWTSKLQWDKDGSVQKGKKYREGRHRWESFIISQLDKLVFDSLNLCEH